MSNQDASIVIVPVANLPKTPLAFQEYVTDYFVEKNVFGIPCMVAFQSLSRNFKKGGGVASRHSVYLMCYKAGLDGESLGSWINRANAEKILWKCFAEWDDGLLHSTMD